MIPGVEASTGLEHAAPLIGPHVLSVLANGVVVVGAVALGYVIARDAAKNLFKNS